MQNETLSIEIQKIHKEHPDMGYRRIRDELDGHKGIHVNDKRVLRICRKYDISQILNGNPKAVPEENEIPITLPKTIYIEIFMRINRMRNGSPMYPSLNITAEMKCTRYI